MSAGAISPREKAKCLPQVVGNLLEKKNQILLPNVIGRISLEEKPYSATKCEDIPSYGKGPWWSTADTGIAMICTKYKAEAPWIIDPSRFPWPEGR